MNVIQCIENYQSASAITKAPDTVRFQRYTALSLIKYFSESGIVDTDQIDDATIDSFVAYSRKTCRNITVNKRIMLLKLIYRHAGISFPYLEGFMKLRQDVIHYDMISDDDTKRILKYVKRLDDDNPMELTVKVIILLLLDSLVRQSELRNIEIRNIDIKSGRIRLTSTKTKRQRFAYFTDLTREPMQKLMRLAPKRKYLLFNYRTYSDFTYGHLRSVFERIKRDLQIQRLHPHMMRHTGATVMLEMGADLITVQHTLGHENISTTEMYIHMTTKKTQAGHDKYGILNNIDID
ncbi:MAG: tyrosine-type recombinase/integrase [Candidatus Izemoplasmatales bacterium]